MSRDGRLGGHLSVEYDGRDFLGGRRIALLRGIGDTGSISAAARTIGMSYKAAWDAVDAMNNLAEHPLVISDTGGKHGGGSRLTDYGKRQIEVFEVLETEYRHMLARIEAAGDAFHELLPWIRRLSLLTSARNQFHSHVVAITSGPVNAEVTLDLGNDGHIVASITHTSLRALELRVGYEAVALIKAPSISIERPGPTDGTHNHLCGQIIRQETSCDEVEIALGLASGKTIVAVVSTRSFKSLGLGQGDEACAAFPASSVLLAVTR